MHEHANEYPSHWAAIIEYLSCAARINTECSASAGPLRTGLYFGHLL